MGNTYYSVTNQCVSKYVINLLDSPDKGVKGFFKKEVLTRFLSSTISVFQAIDLVCNAGKLVMKSIVLTANKVSVCSESGKKINKYVLKTHFKNLFKCAAGVAGGSILSLAVPSLFVPTLFAPYNNPFAETRDSTLRYNIDRHFSKAYVINLEGADQAMERTAEHLNSLGVENWERFEGVKGYTLTDNELRQVLGREDVTVQSLLDRTMGYCERNKRARLGCYLSHLAVLKRARDENLESVLIFEDDVIFPQTQSKVDTFNRAMEELKGQQHDILYLGFNHLKAPVRTTKRLDEVKGGYEAHAYVIYRPCYDRLIEELERPLLDPSRNIAPVDAVFWKLYDQGRFRALAMHPAVAYQRTGFSQIDHKIVSHTNGPDNRSIRERIKDAISIHLNTIRGGVLVDGRKVDLAAI